MYTLWLTPWGGLYDVPHGRANAVLLPVMLEEYGPAACKPLAELADVLPGREPGGEGPGIY